MFAATALAACSSDSEDALMLSEPLPLTVSAAIGTNTRLGTSSDGSEGFSAGDKIYITGTIDGKVQDNLDGEAYKLDADGKWNVVTADNKFFYTTTSEVTFSASYIGDATMQSGGVLTNQAAKDFLFASGATGSVSTGGAVSFTFSHRMAKVAFKFANGKGGVTNATSIQSFTVEGLYTTGSYNTTTGIATPSSSSSTLSNQSTGTWIIVYPQSESDIKVSFSFNDTPYDVTLTKQSLVAGNSYEYTINVNNGGVTVQSSITGWSSGVDDSSLSATWTPEIISDKSKVLKYALVFSDGSFANLLTADEISAISSSSTDAVAALIENRITSLFDSYSSYKSMVSGVVFCLNGADGCDMSADKQLSSSYRNGLIIGKSTYSTAWQTSSYSKGAASSTEYLNRENYDSDIYKNTYSNYCIISADSYRENKGENSYNNVSNLTTIQGYSNTRLFENYNKTIPYYMHYYEILASISGGSYKTCNTPISIASIQSSSMTKVSDTSGWYIPSYKELQLLFSEYNASNSVLKKVLKDVASVEYNGYYWCSSENSKSGNPNFYNFSQSPNSIHTFEQIYPIYYVSQAYLFNNSSGAGTPVLCNKSATTYNSKTIYGLNVCAF
jgi:hypothetical protein